MAILYEDFVWRLQSVTPFNDVRLPQDLEWIDETTYSPIKQKIDLTLTGALVVQESAQLAGRPITLQGKDDMAWIKRDIVQQLMNMRDIPGLFMTLQFVEYDPVTDTYGVVHPLLDFEVVFRHFDAPVLDCESVKRFDNFEPDAWFKVRNIKFMEAPDTITNPCT